MSTTHHSAFSITMVCGSQSVTPMLLESVDDSVNDNDDVLPNHATLVDSDSDSEPIDDSRSDTSSDDEDDRGKEEMRLSTILSQAQGTACPRANIDAEYGQEIYLSEISGDESPSKGKVCAVRKRVSKVKTPALPNGLLLLITIQQKNMYVPPRRTEAKTTLMIRSWIRCHQWRVKLRQS